MSQAKRFRAVCVIAALAISTGTANAEMIHLMARKGDVEKVFAEIEGGVDVDLPSTRHTTEIGVSPLFIAAKFGKAEVVSALIDAGADINRLFADLSSPVAYGTPLHAAAKSGRTDTVKILIEADADLDPYDQTIGTPLHLALKGDHIETAELLLAAGATPTVLQAPISSMISGADLALGEEIVFGCALCHDLEAQDYDPEFRDPPLWNVLDRPIASIAGFVYSQAMSRHGGVWDYETLNHFLAAPKRFMPGTKMTALGIDDPVRRAAVIAYLQTLAD